MLIQRVSDGQTPEHVDVIALNAQGATITLGLPAAITTTAGSVTGRHVVIPATGQVRTLAGIALQSVPNNDVGRFRAYGYVASVAIFAHGTSVTTAVDVVLGPGAGSLGLSSTGLRDNFGPVIALEAIGAAVNSPGGYAKGFARML